MNYFELLKSLTCLTVTVYLTSLLSGSIGWCVTFFGINQMLCFLHFLLIGLQLRLNIILKMLFKIKIDFLQSVLWSL